MTEQEDDPAAIHPNPIDELRQCAVMIRRWMPEAFPENSVGQRHFVRCVVESVADVIDRVLADDAAYKATAEETHDNYHRAHQRAFALHEAIHRIWHAPVYQDGNRDNGISLEMVAAIRGAAHAAGYIGPDAPLTGDLADIDQELVRLNAKGVYPKLGKDMSLSALADELRKL